MFNLRRVKQLENEVADLAQKLGEYQQVCWDVIRELNLDSSYTLGPVYTLRRWVNFKEAERQKQEFEEKVALRVREELAKHGITNNS